MTKVNSTLLTITSLVLTSHFCSAGSATWNLNPTSGDWNTAVNWTPNTVPNSASDRATFDISNTSAVALSTSIQVSDIVFNPGASPYIIAVGPLSLVLTIS